MRRLIIVISIVVVAATAGTIYVGNHTFDGVVVERPYETGLGWDEAQKRQARLGWQVVVETAAVKQGTNEIVIRLADRPGSALNDATVDVTLSRPSTRNYDRTYRAESLGNGRYQVSLFVPLIGIWDLRTSVTRGADTYTTIERIKTTERTR